VATMKAKDVKPGGTILHPDTKMPVRVVQPKDFNTTLADLLAASNAVFAVDDESGLYAIPAEADVEVRFSVPLVMTPSGDNYLIVATFERLLTDDLPVLRRNFKAGRITADPDKDFALAAMQQVALEVGLAYDEGMAGCFQCHRTIQGRSFDAASMGWRDRGRR
jgi:hypothetical protein